MKIADMPGRERPRERLVRLGPSALSDRELLALLIRSGGQGKSALDVADGLLSDGGTLSALAASRLEELESTLHLGSAKAASVVAAFELGRRAGASEDPRPVIRGAADLARIVEPLLKGKKQEELMVIVLNGVNRVIKIVSLTKGGSNRCLMMTRDVLACVLRSDGQAFAVAHNHPSGDPTPSGEDLAATYSLAEAAHTAGLGLVDHIIIGAATWISLRESKGFD